MRNSEKSSNFAGFLLGETAPRAIKLKMENGKLKMGNLIYSSTASDPLSKAFYESHWLSIA